MLISKNTIGVHLLFLLLAHKRHLRISSYNLCAALFVRTVACTYTARLCILSLILTTVYAYYHLYPHYCLCILSLIYPHYCLCELLLVLILMFMHIITYAYTAVFTYHYR